MIEFRAIDKRRKTQKISISNLTMRVISLTFAAMFDSRRSIFINRSIRLKSFWKESKIIFLFFFLWWIFLAIFFYFESVTNATMNGIVGCLRIYDFSLTMDWKKYRRNERARKKTSVEETQRVRRRVHKWKLAKNVFFFDFFSYLFFIFVVCVSIKKRH